MTDTSITTPYIKDVVQYYRIMIQPRHMNTKIEDNINMILKREVEKKCNKDCYIDEVNGIINYSECDMNAENLSGSALYDIKFICNIYLPIENTFIISKVLSISSDEIFLENGPLLIVSRLSLIKNPVWKVEGSNIYNKEFDKQLQIGDYVSTFIFRKKINNGETIIKVLGVIDNFVDEKTINKYFGKSINNNEEDKEEIKEELEEDNYII